MSQDDEDMKASFERMRAAHLDRESTKAQAAVSAADMQSAAQKKYRDAVVAVDQTAGGVLEKFKTYLETELKANATIERGIHNATPFVLLRFGPMMTVGGGLLRQAHMFGVSVDQTWTTFHTSTQLSGRPLTVTSRVPTLTAKWVTTELEKAYTAAMAL